MYADFRMATLKEMLPIAEELVASYHWWGSFAPTKEMALAVKKLEAIREELMARAKGDM